MSNEITLKSKSNSSPYQNRGKVQGVGFRPTVYRYATERNLAGWVTNISTSIITEAEGEKWRIEDFINNLRKSLLPRSEITGSKATEIPIKNECSFQVISSILEEEIKTRVSPDTTTCKGCLKELFDPEDRRYFYPSINCTNCGPHFTIIQNILYDRPNKYDHKKVHYV